MVKRTKSEEAWLAGRFKEWLFGFLIPTMRSFLILVVSLPFTKIHHISQYFGNGRKDSN